MTKKRNDRQPEASAMRRSLMGLNHKDVQDRIASLSAMLQQAMADNESLRNRERELEEQLAGLGSVQSKLDEFLEEARRISILMSADLELKRDQLVREIEQRRRDVLAQASKEAGLIVKEAMDKARKIVLDTENRLAMLHDSMQRADAARLSTIARIKALLASQVRFMDALERDDLAAPSMQLETLYSQDAGISDEVIKTVVDSLAKKDEEV
jgi:cell division septum initiation protein DivIVA